MAIANTFLSFARYKADQFKTKSIRKLCGQKSGLKSRGKKTRKKITIVQLEVVSPASLNADQSGKPITSITLMGGTPVNTEKNRNTKMLMQ